MLKDILFALSLGIKVIGIFLICIIIGMKLDSYFQTKFIYILCGIMVAFIYNIKLLIGVKKRE